MVLVNNSSLKSKCNYQLIVKLKAIKLLHEISLLFIFLHSLY